MLHLTYLIEENRNIFVNHLKYKGYIKDYDLVILLVLNIEIRIFDFYLHWKLQADFDWN